MIDVDSPDSTAILKSTMAGQETGNLTARYTPVAWAVVCLIETLRRAEAQRRAIAQAKRDRILKLHDNFAETQLAAMRAAGA